MSLIDDFNILEIPTNATEQEAKAAYRRLARRYHPDKNPDRDTTEHFQRIHDAYQNVISAIKRSQGQSWQPYSFTEQTSSGKSRSGADFDQYEFASDAKQREYVKEQQRAYQEMKRGNAQQERAREEAIRNARSTLHQRRMNALYEEMRKADSNNSAKTDFGQDYSDSNADTESAYQNTNFDYQSAASFANSQPTSSHSHTAKPFRLHAAKAAFIACTYISVFAMGIYSADYWTSLKSSTVDDEATPYISGLYPQFRVGANYTLNETRLFTEPSVASDIKTTLPPNADVSVQRLEGDWLALTYDNFSGWAKAQNFGFGTYQHAQETACIGQPGLAPRHGTLLGNVEGNSRLRILNQLETSSLLSFQSLDGQPPFSIYLQAQQPFAANFIPKGRYRLVLETGSLYHHGCQRFLYNELQRVVLDEVSFASTEQTLTLRNLISQ